MRFRVSGSLFQVSLRTRFALGLGAVLLPFLVAAAVGQFHLLPRLIGPLDDIVREFTEKREPVTHLQTALLQAAMPVNDYLIHGDPDERRQFAELRQRVDEAFQEAAPEQFTLVEESALISSARALLGDELARAQRFQRPLSLILLDIDHFKRVNDTYGHLAGDAVIKGLGELLRREARAIDRVCRYGGEEIAVILPEIGLDAAANFAERLRAAVEAQPFDVNAGAPLHITASIGVASFPAHADSAEALVAAADAAMYAAKQDGRNRVVQYEPALAQPATPG